MKAVKNFSCNGVRKKAGESLDAKELEKIGKDLLKDLQSKDLVANSPKSEPVKKEEPKELPKKVKKKVLKKEA